MIEAVTSAVALLRHAIVGSMQREHRPERDREESHVFT
jgi:hypothetical protein